MTTKAKRAKVQHVRMELKPGKGPGGRRVWVVTSQRRRGGRRVLIMVNADKRATVKWSAHVARLNAVPGRRTISLRIHDKRGKFQSERTYPRSADPRRRKG